jgi:two-component system LytT family sensor kinase
MTKTVVDTNKLVFYIWVGLTYMLLAFFGDLARYPGTFIVKLLNEIWRAAYAVAVNFIFYEYALPYIRRRRKYILWRILVALLVLFAELILYSLGMYLWRTIGIGLHLYTELRTFRSMEEGISFQFGYCLGSAFFFGIIGHIYNYNRLKQAAQQLKIEKQAAELNYLRSQTNPHFLFNTLNNIYSLARDKNDLAPESILRLSKILRFMLYETGAAFIAIEDELKIISDYIALEKLRYDDSLRINFNHDIEDMKQSLPPLLLIPLVENAFKHGVSETRNQPYVNIHLSVNNRQLIFIVKNSADMLSAEQTVKENIGLSNLRRQLELLFKEFNLSFGRGESAFTATLKINLASHV